MRFRILSLIRYVVDPKFFKKIFTYMVNDDFFVIET